MMPRYALPLLFVLVLALFAGGVWVYQQLTPAAGGTTELRPDFFGALFPFGSDITGELLDGSSTDQERGPVPEIRRLTDTEVAGATFAYSNGARVVRYVERETGHIYEVPVDSYTATRLTNTTVTAVHDAVWLTASSTIFRFLDDDGVVQHFYGSFASSSPDQALQGTFIEPYQRFMPGARGAFIAGVKESRDGSQLVIDDLVRPPRTVLVSPIRSWVPVVAGNDVLVASAPSAEAVGTLYEVEDGELHPRMSGLGLAALPNPAGTHVLLSSGGRRVVNLAFMRLADDVLVTVARGGMVEKCAWVGLEPRALCALSDTLPLADYPDDWLLGKAQTADSLWFIDAETGVLTSAADTAGQTFDVHKLVVSDSGSHAAFVDRVTGFLWLVTLNASI